MEVENTRMLDQKKKVYTLVTILYNVTKLYKNKYRGIVTLILTISMFNNST